MSSQPLRLTFVIASLGSGGAERVMSELANHLCEEGYPVSFVTLDTSISDHYWLNPQVERRPINIFWESRSRLDSIIATVKRMLMIRRAIAGTRPDVVLSFIDMTNIRVLAAMSFSGVPIVVSERIDPRQHDIGGNWARLRSRIYPLAARLVVQTRAVADWAGSVVSPSRVDVIPNFVRRTDTTLPRPEGLPSGRTIIGAGRLARQKGFDLLIRAFAYSGLSEAGWQLVVLGEGAERSSLEAQVRGAGLTESVLLPGNVPDIDAWYTHADIFVLASRYEGFPNVLMEAMACGLPSIAFDCRSGPADIIVDGVNGLLLSDGDGNALSEAMIRLANDTRLRERLAKSATEIKQRYSMKQVAGQWLATFNSVRNNER